MKKPLALIILDGYGLAPAGPTNAISLADTPVMDRLLSVCPWKSIRCSGMDVGLPDRPDGQQRSGPHQHRRRPGGLSGADPHHQSH